MCQSGLDSLAAESRYYACCGIFPKGMFTELLHTLCSGSVQVGGSVHSTGDSRYSFSVYMYLEVKITTAL